MKVEFIAPLLAGGIDDYVAAREESALFYTIRKDHMIKAWQALRAEFKNDLEFGHGIHKVSELWKLDLTTWRAVKVVDAARFIRYFDVSPDGHRIAMITDPDRLCVMGWSNGGFLTNCLIASNRFKAASSGAGVIDQAIQWGEEDTPGHVINYMQGLPWEKPDAYQQASPLYHFTSEIQTATLIHAGKKDERVPVSHSRTHFLS
jgi:hypothetical protein